VLCTTCCLTYLFLCLSLFVHLPSLHPSPLLSASLPRYIVYDVLFTVSRTFLQNYCGNSDMCISPTSGGGAIVCRAKRAAAGVFLPDATRHANRSQGTTPKMVKALSTASAEDAKFSLGVLTTCLFFLFHSSNAHTLSFIRAVCFTCMFVDLRRVPCVHMWCLKRHFFVIKFL